MFGPLEARVQRNLCRFLALTIGLLAVFTGCHPRIRSTADTTPTPAQMAQLWIEPPPNRDLFVGVGGPELAPDPAARYRIIEVKRHGFSPGYTVVGPGEREWSVKLPPEGRTEIVASRIHWGIGFHQPPVYLLEAWHPADGRTPDPQPPARFREKSPRFHGELDSGPGWSYYQNPFVGTQPLAGLLVLQVLLGNSDLKDANNSVYKLEEPHEGASTWYVAKDVGHTFGRTGVMNAPRGDIEVFETTPFIRGVEDGLVRFHYDGRHQALFTQIRVEDVVWTCSLLDRLTDRQWHDAFRAGGYDRHTAERFIRRLKQRIAEGLALSR